MGAALGLFRDGMNQSTAAMVLVLTVVAAAATGDRVAGVAAALAAAGAFDFFLTEPFYSLSIHHRDDLELALALVVVGLAVTEIALWGRRQQAAAQRRDGYISGLTQLLDLPPDTTEQARSTAIATAITTVLGADRCTWDTGSPPLERRRHRGGRPGDDGGTTAPCRAHRAAHRRLHGGRRPSRHRRRRSLPGDRVDPRRAAHRASS